MPNLYFADIAYHSACHCFAHSGDPPDKKFKRYTESAEVNPNIDFAFAAKEYKSTLNIKRICETCLAVNTMNFVVETQHKSQAHTSPLGNSGLNFLQDVSELIKEQRKF